MAEAGTSDAQLAGYLKHVEQEVGRPQETGRVRQLAAIALWHIGALCNHSGRKLGYAAHDGQL